MLDTSLERATSPTLDTEMQSVTTSEPLTEVDIVHVQDARQKYDEASTLYESSTVTDLQQKEQLRQSVISAGVGLREEQSKLIAEKTDGGKTLYEAGTAKSLIALVEAHIEQRPDLLSLTGGSSAAQYAEELTQTLETYSQLLSQESLSLWKRLPNQDPVILLQLIQAFSKNEIVAPESGLPSTDQELIDWVQWTVAENLPRELLFRVLEETKHHKSEGELALIESDGVSDEYGPSLQELPEMNQEHKKKVIAKQVFSYVVNNPDNSLTDFLDAFFSGGERGYGNFSRGFSLPEISPENGAITSLQLEEAIGEIGSEQEVNLLKYVLQSGDKTVLLGSIPVSEVSQMDNVKLRSFFANESIKKEFISFLAQSEIARQHFVKWLEGNGDTKPIRVIHVEDKSSSYGISQDLVSTYLKRFSK